MKIFTHSWMLLKQALTSRRSPVLMSSAVFMTGVFVLLSISFTGPVLAWQQSVPVSPECKPLDVVVILDESDSMSVTDPTDLRKDAVGNVIDILYENAAFRCPGTTHRVGVIGFGDSADIMIDLADTASSVRVDDIESDWERARDRLKAKIRPNQMGNTSFRDAFEFADRMLGTAPPADDNLPRQRVVLVVTDGAPCTPGANALNIPELNGVRACQSPNWLVHYLLGNESILTQYNGEGLYENAGFDFPAGLENYLSATQTLGGATSINVLLFTQPNKSEDLIPGSVNEAWQQIVGLHNGHYYSPQDINGDQRQVTIILEGIISENIGVPREDIDLTKDSQGQCVGKFTLEPYVSSTTIIAATRPGSDERVQLFQPDGTPLPPQNTIVGGSSVRYNEGRTIQRYVITDPLPGEWEIKDPTGVCDVEATKETITIVPAALRPVNVIPVISTPYYIEDNNSPYYMKLTLTTRDNTPFNEIPGYPLEIVGIISVTPSNSATLVPNLEPIKFIFDEKEGEWRSEHPVPAPVRGEYTVNITATTKSVADPNEVKHIFNLTTSYSTADPTAIHMEVVAPVQGAVLPLNELQNSRQVDLPFSVSVRFVDSSGNPQLRDNIFPNGADNMVQAVLETAEDSNVPPRGVFLTASPNDQYQMVAVFEKPTGNNDADPAGEYELNFSLTSQAIATYNQENYLLEGAEQEVSFSRRELEGIGLKTVSPDPDMPLMLNHIENNLPVENDIPVEVQLVNQSGDALPADQVFTSDLNNAVQAVLRDPDGKIITTIQLAPSSGDISVFSGVFSRHNLTGADIGSGGTYTVDFTFGSGTTTPTFDAQRYTYLSTANDSVSFERVELRGVQPILLSVAGKSPAVEDSPASYELNSLNAEGAPVPTRLDVSATLADLNGNPYTVDDLNRFLSDDNPQALKAVIDGPDGSNVHEEVWLTRGSDGRFTGVLRGGELLAVDPPGVYRVSVEINADTATLLKSDTNYEVVRFLSESSAYINRYSRRGVGLALTGVNGSAVTPETLASPIVLPLYSSPMDAFRGAVSSIPFTLKIYDTTAQTTLTWESVARPNSDDQAPLTIADLVTVGLQKKNSSEVAVITELTEESLGDGSVVIRGLLNGINDTEEYVVFYGLSSSNMNNVSAVNFSDISSANRASFSIVRNIPSLFHDPQVWNVAKPVLAIVVIVLALWLWMVNLGPLAMRGEMVVTVEKPGQREKRDEISLGGLKLWPSKRGKNTGAVVRRAGRGSARASGPGFGGGAPSQAGRSRRAYEVTIEGRPFTVQEGQEGGIIGGYKAKHRYRVAESTARPPSAAQH